MKDQLWPCRFCTYGDRLLFQLLMHERVRHNAQGVPEQTPDDEERGRGRASHSVRSGSTPKILRNPSAQTQRAYARLES